MPDDQAWECDCRAEEDPCAHVAAAVIALRGARRDGKALPLAAGSGRVAYRFRSTAQGLSLERVVIHAGGETRLTSTLSALATGRSSGPPVSPSRIDLTIESVLGSQREGPLPRGILHALLPLLAAHPDVSLDGSAVETSREPLGTRARLRDDADGFRLSVAYEPPPERDLGGGFVLCAGTIRELAPLQLGGREREELLGAGRRFTPDEAALLVADVLPSIESRMPVQIETERLPSSRRLPPRLSIETARGGDGLSVLATLVYGEPVCARVDAGRLVHLRGPIPLRDEEAESQLITRLRAALGLAPGHRVELAPDVAVDFVERLERFDARLSGDAHRAFRRAAPLEPELRVRGDGFTLRFRAQLAGEEREADPSVVLAAFRRGESLVPLLGGGFAPLPADWLARFGAPLADLLAARERSGRVPTVLLPDLARLCAQLDQPPPPGLEGLRALIEGDWPEAPLPADLRGELRAYQHEGVRWLLFLGAAGLGGLLADDMGLGKTLQALAALEAGRWSSARPACCSTGRRDRRAFGPASRSASTTARAARSKQARTSPSRPTRTLRWTRRRWRQGVGQPWSSTRRRRSRTRTVRWRSAAFGCTARFRLALTGTPVENRLDELWSLMHFTNRGLLGGCSDFDERYARRSPRATAKPPHALRARIAPVRAAAAQARGGARAAAAHRAWCCT